MAERVQSASRGRTLRTLRTRNVASSFGQTSPSPNVAAPDSASLAQAAPRVQEETKRVANRRNDEANAQQKADDIDGLKSTLWSHQKQCLDDMVRKEDELFARRRNVALLCADIGAGKSLNVLALIANSRTVQPDYSRVLSKYTPLPTCLYSIIHRFTREPFERLLEYAKLQSPGSFQAAFGATPSVPIHLPAFGGAGGTGTGGSIGVAIAAAASVAAASGHMVPTHVMHAAHGAGRGRWPRQSGRLGGEEDDTDDARPSLRIPLLHFGRPNAREINTNLVVVPFHLYKQWRTEIVTRTSLRCTFIDTKTDIDEINHKRWEKENVDLILCNSNKYKAVAQHCGEHRLRFQRVIFDEVHEINLPHCPETLAVFYWGITTSFTALCKIRNFGFLRDMFRQLSVADINEIAVKTSPGDLDPRCVNFAPYTRLVIECRSSAEKAILNECYPTHRVTDFVNEDADSDAHQYLVRSVEPSGQNEQVKRLAAAMRKMSLLELMMMSVRLNQTLSDYSRNERLFLLVRALYQRQVCARCTGPLPHATGAHALSSHVVGSLPTTGKHGKSRSTTFDSHTASTTAASAAATAIANSGGALNGGGSHSHGTCSKTASANGHSTYPSVTSSYRLTCCKVPYCGRCVVASVNVTTAPAISHCPYCSKDLHMLSNSGTSNSHIRSQGSGGLSTGTHYTASSEAKRSRAAVNDSNDRDNGLSDAEGDSKRVDPFEENKTDKDRRGQAFFDYYQQQYDAYVRSQNRRNPKKRAAPRNFCATVQQDYRTGSGLGLGSAFGGNWSTLDTEGGQYGIGANVSHMHRNSEEALHAMGMSQVRHSGPFVHVQPVLKISHDAKRRRLLNEVRIDSHLADFRDAVCSFISPFSLDKFEACEAILRRHTLPSALASSSSSGGQGGKSQCDRVLIFINCRTAALRVSHLLDDLNVTHSELKGSATIVTKRIKQFEDRQLHALVLNAQHIGYGLNIPCADVMILVHTPSEPVRLQLIGRGQRHHSDKNKKRSLKVYELKYSGLHG